MRTVSPCRLRQRRRQAASGCHPAEGTGSGALPVDDRRRTRGGAAAVPRPAAPPGAPGAARRGPHDRRPRRPDPDPAVLAAGGRRRPRLPVVMFFHGGGWVVGDLDTYDGDAREHAVGTGALVVSVDYRLAPEHPYPGGGRRRVGRDAVGGRARRRTRAPTRRGSRSRVTRPAATSPRWSRSWPATRAGRRSRFQLLWYPATTWDTVAAVVHRERRRTDPRASTRSASSPAGTPGPVTCRNPPATLVPGRATDFAGLAPAYIAVAGHDPLRDDGVRYGELLARRRRARRGAQRRDAGARLPRLRRRGARRHRGRRTRACPRFVAR